MSAAECLLGTAAIVLSILATIAGRSALVVVEGKAGQRCDTGVGGGWRKRGGGNDVAVSVELAEDPAVGRFAAQDTDRPDLADRVDIEFGCWASGGRRRETRVDGRCRGGPGVGGLLAPAAAAVVVVSTSAFASSASSSPPPQAVASSAHTRMVRSVRFLKNDTPPAGQDRIDMRGIVRLVSEVEGAVEADFPAPPRSRGLLFPGVIVDSPSRQVAELGGHDLEQPLGLGERTVTWLRVKDESPRNMAGRSVVTDKHRALPKREG